jgi:peptide/nickel transport system substrate-binding protein
VLPLQFDVLVHAWIDLSSDAPPAFMHSQFFSSTGAFRAGPPIPEFDELLGRFAVATDQRVVTELTTDLDRFAYDQALSVFLCAPQALYAVNRHVAFDGYAATFELAETEVAPEHWSRR